jgi:hypothetical protein
MIIRGIFQGKNIFLQNPEDTDGYGFCIRGVLVNGEEPPRPGSAFEVDINSLVRKGDSVEVLVFHGRGCKPKLLNPEVLLPLSTFEIVSMNIDSSGVLYWTAKNENGHSTYMIQQFRWNKWVTIGEMKEKGPGENSYSFTPLMHSGKNILRLKQTDHTNKSRLSDTVEFLSDTPVAKILSNRVHDKIVFSGETRYEIYDAYGNIVKKGLGISVDCKNLKKGAYYVNFDNCNEKVIVTR